MAEGREWELETGVERFSAQFLRTFVSRRQVGTSSVTKELAEALARLPETAPITIAVTLKKGDLSLAMSGVADGPEEMGTGQAAKHLGRNSKWWRRQCEKGLIPSAYLDESGRWRFAKKEAKDHLRRIANKETRIRSVRRGPWKPQTPTAQAS